MLFALKKFVGILFMPLPLILLLLFISIIFFNKKPRFARYTLVMSTALLVLLSLSPVSDTFIEPLEQKYPVYSAIHGDIDFIVILGCGHTSDKRLAALHQLKQCSLQRLTEGLRVSQLHPNAKIITSGKSRYDPITNAVVVKRAAMELGIDSDRLVTEARPLDTKEEAFYISNIVSKQSMVLVTNAYHMPRAMQYFIEAGITPIPAPSGHFVKESQVFRWGDYVPKAMSLKQMELMWHERLGLLWQWISH